MFYLSGAAPTNCRPRYLLVGHGRVISKCRHHQGGLANVGDIHALRCVHVGMVRANIIVYVVLDGIEPRDTGGNEGQVVGLGCFSSKATLAMMNPGVQNPHMSASLSQKAC